MAISRYWTLRGLEEIRAEPLGWLRLMVKKCWLTLWNAEIPNNKDFAFLQQEYVWLRILPVRWVVLLMLAPAGIWVAVKWGSREALFVLVAYAVLYSAANVAFFICDRYRYPVWPVMAAIGGGAVFFGLQALRLRQLKVIVWILGSAVLMGILSLPNWFGARLPSFAQDYHFRSTALYQRGRFQDALSDIDRSIELDPLNAAAHHHRGNVLFALGRLPEARASYEQTVKLIPGDSGAWNNLGAALDALGATNEALEAYRRATEGRLPSENAFFGIAFIQIRAGRLEEAAAALDRLERLQPTPSATSLAIRSIIERKRGNLQQADSLERQARGLDPAAAAWVIERAAQAPVSR